MPDMLLTLAELRTRAPTLASVDDAQLTAAIEDVTSDIQAAAKQRIVRVVDDAAVLRGNWTGVLELPERPVIDVSSVTIGGAAVDYLWDDFCFLYRSRVSSTAGTWGGPKTLVTVTYTHGYDPVPGWVQAMAADMVTARTNIATAGSGGVTQETIGSYSVTYSSGAAQISAQQRARLRRVL